MRRSNEREFMAEVLRDVPELPEGFRDRFAALLEKDDPDRSSAIRALFEEYSGE